MPIKPGLQQSFLMNSRFRMAYSRIHRVYSSSRALHSRIHRPYSRIRPQHSKIHVLHTIRYASLEMVPVGQPTGTFTVIEAVPCILHFAVSIQEFTECILNFERDILDFTDHIQGFEHHNLKFTFHTQFEWHEKVPDTRYSLRIL